MPEQEWQQLKLQDADQDPLARLERERDNHLRNAAGWRRQADRIRSKGHDPGDLLDKIAEAEREANRVSAEIVRVQRGEYDERQRKARLAHGDQAVELGRRLPSTGEEK